MKNTKQQDEVLNHKVGNLLVSASAGSGKTFIMVEKISQLICEKKCRPTELLVVTFTVAAADEMKKRISKSLKEKLNNSNDDAFKDYLNDCIEELSISTIGTIHSFCSKELKKFSYNSNISPAFQILEGSREKSLISEAFNISDKTLFKAPEKLNKLLEVFSGKNRNLDSFHNAVLSFHYSYLLQEDNEYKDNIITNTANNFNTDIKNTDAYKYYFDYVKSVLCFYKKRIKELFLGFSDSADLTKNKSINNLETLIDSKDIDSILDNIKKTIVSIANIKTDNEYDDEYKTEIKSVLENYSKKINNLVANLPKIKDSSSLQEESLSIIKLFLEYVEIFNSTYIKIKTNNNLLDFNDLERNMYKLLNNDEIRNELLSTYKYVFIDEFQDVNILQSDIAAKISNGQNLFLVGDIKQSIYGFRNATPKLFSEKFFEYKQENNSNKTIEMNTNFRSSPKILNFVNDLFNNIMTEKESDIDYKKYHNFDSTFIEEDTSGVEINLYKTSSKKNNDIDNITLTENKSINDTLPIYSVKNDKIVFTDNEIDDYSIHIVNKIKSLIGSEIYLFGKEKKRKIVPSDIAILTKSTTDEDSKRLQKALSLAGINYNIELDLITDSVGIESLHSIMNLLNNSESDASFIYYLNNFCNFSFDDLSDILSNGRQCVRKKLIEYMQNNNNNNNDLSIKIESAITNIKNMQKEVINKNINEIFDYLLYEKNMYAMFAVADNGEVELANIKKYIQTLDSSILEKTLSEYLEYKTFISESKIKFNLNMSDAITFQTIHKSKGLEYPVVIMLGADKKYFDKFANQLYTTDKFGISINNFNLFDRVEYNSYSYLSNKLYLTHEGIKENLRLLYVAMTRAKNKLIIYGKYTDNFIDKIGYEKNSFLKNILPVYPKILKQKSYHHSLFTSNLLDQKATMISFDENIIESASLDMEKYKNLCNFKYKFDNKNILKKNSITLTSKMLNDEYNFYDEKLQSNTKITLPPEDAELGTLYHFLFEKIDFCSDEDEILTILNNYPTIDKNIFLNCIDTLRNISSSKIKKEAKFIMECKYNEIFSESTFDDKILLQGVVDLIIFENDNTISIIDYKLSNSSSNTLKSRYTNQLLLYKKAVELAYKLPVKNTYILNIKQNQIIKI